MPSESRGVVVHVRATGSQLFSPQWVAAVSSVHCTQVPAAQTFSFGPVHWSSSSQGAQVFVTRSQREAVGSVQSVSAAHATHAPTKPRPAKRAATLPEDFTLTDTRRTYALSKNIPADIEFEAFTNHHTAKGSTFKDWDAAWRTWVGNAVKFGRSTRDVPTPTRIAPYERAGIIYDDHGVYADWHNATPVSRAGQIIHDPLGRAGTPIVGGAEDLWAEYAAKEAS